MIMGAASWPFSWLSTRVNSGSSAPATQSRPAVPPR